MDTKRELKIALGLLVVFLSFFWLPLGDSRFDTAVSGALELTKLYAREHVVLCLFPAFWIAGAVASFVSRESVMRYLGPNAPRSLAYGVGSVSGAILAVCSCTVLPLFAGIYGMGAGLGPAATFLYSGPAINVLAIAFTAKALGLEIGLARAFGAILCSVLIGLAIAFLFRRDEGEKTAKAAAFAAGEAGRPLWKTGVFFAAMIGLLVFLNWGQGSEGSGFFTTIHAWKWWISSALAVVFFGLLWRWFRLPGWKLMLVSLVMAVVAIATGGRATWVVSCAMLGLVYLTAGRSDEAGEWFEQTWSYTKQVMPLLLGGVLLAGLLLGSPSYEGLIPSDWVGQSVGGDGFGAILFASVAGALMYFATLTEIPILQGLLGSGMGKGPALALLLAGPALSLPNMLVINSIIGPKKTVAYVALVVTMSSVAGWGYGLI